MYIHNFQMFGKVALSVACIGHETITCEPQVQKQQSNTKSNENGLAFPGIGPWITAKSLKRGANDRI